MNTKLKPIFLRLAVMGMLELACVYALWWAFKNENINVVTIACLLGAVVHTRLAPNEKELAAIKAKKS